MEVITKKSFIQNAARNFEQQYPIEKYKDTSHYKTLLKLKELPENHKESDVTTAIGNNSWTLNICHQCKQDVDLVVIVGEPEDYESSTARLCLPCLRDAVKLGESYG